MNNLRFILQKVLKQSSIGNLRTLNKSTKHTKLEKLINQRLFLSHKVFSERIHILVITICVL